MGLGAKPQAAKPKDNFDIIGTYPIHICQGYIKSFPSCPQLDISASQNIRTHPTLLPSTSTCLAFNGRPPLSESGS